MKGIRKVANSDIISNQSYKGILLIIQNITGTSCRDHPFPERGWTPKFVPLPANKKCRRNKAECGRTYRVWPLCEWAAVVRWPYNQWWQTLRSRQTRWLTCRPLPPLLCLWI